MDRLDIAPDGDLILVVDNKLELLVHTCVLRLTSPVFKAMLGPDFAEGQSHGTAANPKRLDLPEDDEEGIRYLCLVLHQANQHLPETMSTAQLLRFSMMVDKYDCTSAVWGTAQAWLSEYQTAKQIDVSLLCSVYLLNDAKAYKRLCNQMIRFGDEHYFKELETYQDAIPLAHAEMIGPVLEARVTALRKLNEKILSVVEDISQYMMPEWDHRADSQPQEDGTARAVPDRCKYFEGLVDECLRALGSASIWPRQSQEGTVHGLLCAINEFKVDPLLGVGVKEEGCFFCVQKLLEGTFCRSISSLRDEATKVSTLLCLDCVKNGGRPPVDRECRIAHN